MSSREERRRIVVFATAFLVLACVTAAVFYSLNHNYSKLILDSQSEQLMNIAEAVTNSMKVYLEEYETVAEEVIEIDQFRTAERKAMEGDSSAMNEMLSQIQYSRREALARIDFFLRDKGLVSMAGDPMPHSYFRILGNDDTFRQITINKTSDGRFSFGLTVETEEKNRLVLYVDADKMFEKTSEYLHMGENGYVMIKDSKGIILMHQVDAQVGINVLVDRKLQHPDFDFSELEVLIAHQLEGRTGVETYNSYWWADENPRKTRKVSAYMPLPLGNDFLVISAVIDYSEVAGRIEAEAVRFMAIVILVLSVGIICLIFLWGLLQRQRITEDENKNLRQKNEDLERLRREEEQMAHQQRLELIGTMTSGIAHEFNNLLTPIVGYSSLILEGMDASDENYEDMKEIADTAEKARQIISQINQFSSRNAEQMLQPIHVAESVRSALVIAEAAKRRNISLKVQVDDAHDVCVGNPLQIQQIVVNLCNNAIQAMGTEKGILTVTGTPVKAETEREPKLRQYPDRWYYRIRVEDTGIGMDKETMEQLFIPFFTTKRPGEGTGLGLAVVYRMVEAHGGVIGVESTPGEGSTFSIYLPLLAVPEEAVEPYGSVDTEVDYEEPVRDGE